MKTSNQISIYNFTDYRLYLKAYYEEQKAINPVFSYRYFAKQAGFSSCGLYKDVVNGRTGIARGLIIKFATGMKLTQKQQEYFEIMVYFNEAKTVDEKTLYFERLMKYQSARAFHVNATQYEYFSKWYYTAIRELLACGNYKDNYSAIGQALNPTVRMENARKAIEVLKELGLIAKNKDGYYKPVDNILTTGTEIHSLAVANFQKSMMDLAKEAIDRHTAENRNISTVTFSVSKESFDEINAELDSCRKKILSIIDKSKNEDRVCQLNMQLFPLTQIKEK